MNKFINVNIRQFEEEETPYIVDGELNISGLVDSYKEEPEEIEEVEEEPEIVPEVTPDPEPEEDPDTEQEIDTEKQESKNTPDQAFAEMRRQVEANEPLAKWVQDLATQQGFKDPQELIKAYDEQRIAKEAEAQGVPVDVYQRLHELEKENQESKTKVAETQFNSEVEAVKLKNNLTDDQITEVFRFMGQNGYDAGTIPFEHAYMLANSETLIKDAEERGRQSYLEEKKRKQNQATPNISTHVKDKEGQDDLEISKEAVFAKLAEYDIDPD